MANDSPIARRSQSSYRARMEQPEIIYWLIFGAVLVISEAILPGLVSVFVGMGAITVAGLLYTHQIESFVVQLITFFSSSIFYIFTLRLIVVKLYPTDTRRQEIDEDAAVFGQRAEVVEAIVSGGVGRISHSGSTWPAKTKDDSSFIAGDEVTIVDRDNITWIVDRSSGGDT